MHLPEHYYNINAFSLQSIRGRSFYPVQWGCSYGLPSASPRWWLQSFAQQAKPASWTLCSGRRNCPVTWICITLTCPFRCDAHCPLTAPTCCAACPGLRQLGVVRATQRLPAVWARLSLEPKTHTQLPSSLSLPMGDCTTAGESWVNWQISNSQTSNIYLMSVCSCQALFKLISFSSRSKNPLYIAVCVYIYFSKYFTTAVTGFLEVCWIQLQFFVHIRFTFLREKL